MKETVFYFPITPLRSPYYQLAVEEAISLHLVSEGLTAGVRFWKNPESIILGLSENPYRNIKDTVVANFEKFVETNSFHKKPEPNLCYIARRASGGGTVYHSPTGNVNYSIYINLNERKEFFPVRESYELLLGFVKDSLAKQNLNVEKKGKSDLVFELDGETKKISGNAQFRKRNCIVQHGTLILEPELIQTVTNVLNHPPEEPDYRKERPHKDFLTSLPKQFSLSKWEVDLTNTLRSYLGLEPLAEISEISFFGKGFSTFRKRVFQESEIIRKSKYQNPNYTLHREITT
ncbi:lipoate--protein ligase family protein [Leptospira sp. 96542]|nr:lipoate--protein ligase family protein [Leptospira sp. 96542]